MRKKFRNINFLQCYIAVMKYFLSSSAMLVPMAGSA